MTAAPAGRLPLQGDWAMAPGVPGQDAPPADAPWLPIAGPQPVAAALAEAGQWSLDGPARDFDRECWWYRCRFEVAADQACDGAVLGFDGLATLAQAWLNGAPILASRSMFRPHRVPVAAQLRAGLNELWMRFDPLADALAVRRPRPRWRTPMLAQQQLRWFRTTLLGRTPGWSPPAAVVGPWRPIWLACAPGESPVDLHWHARAHGGIGELAVRVAWPAGADVQAVRVRVDHAGERHEQPLVPAGLADVPSGDATGGAAQTWAGTLRIEQPRLWWPHTHGEPVRHPAWLVVTRHGQEQLLPLGPVGFRAVQADTTGGGFGLVVNGQPVFARGVCWTPLDTLRLQAPAEVLRPVLQRLRDAGLNLVRVPGTMAYESADFLALCDELGLMVWHDLMFASMDYPGEDPDFLDDVDAELAAQLGLWARHASVVVVCGNSEVEQQAAMWGAPREQWQPPLFHAHIAPAVAAALPGCVWWPSSAHGGAFPFEPRHGTTSYYGVGAYRRGLDDARHSGLRFATECLAFAQVPTDAALARLRVLNDGLPLRATHPLWKSRACRDLGAGWDFDDVRDHYVQQLFGEDPVQLRQTDPQRHLVLGRAAAAEATVGAFDRWRAAGSACRGALVWFLRDLWAGPGWGLLDDQGLPKAAFHALSRACQPLHWAVLDDGLNGLTLHAVNEHDQPMPGRLQLVLLREGEWPVADGQVELVLAARSARALALTDVLPGFFDASWAYRFGPRPADTLVLRWQADSGATVERVLFLGERLVRADIGLAAEARALDADTVELTVRTRAAARGVHLEAEGWRAEDDHFDLAPGAERRLRCTRWPGQPPRAWRASVNAVNAWHPAAAPLASSEG